VAIDGDRVVRGSSPAASRSFAEIAASAEDGRIATTGCYETSGVLDPETGQGVAAAHWHQAAAAAEVEVDLETGSVEVVRYHTVVYAGRVVNPVQAELQTEGNIAFGIGQALFEEMQFDSGQLTNANLSEYMVPSMLDMPPMSLQFLEDGDEDPEIHGLGETALPAVAPAVGNAVARAIGRRITTLPLTPEKILRAVRSNAVLDGNQAAAAGRP
jgi:CO/xanthine dehydrogenase Mo-binding subunit